MRWQRIHTIAMAAVLAAGAALAGASDKCGDKAKGFQSLFDGKTLKGWHAMPGGKWEAKDGMIVGTSKKSERRHGLLVSDAEYSDFVVRFKFRVVKGNSGFYFRSEKVKSAVGVHGFQAEVANESDVAGLYETGGRAWVKKPDAKQIEKLYKPGEWNDMSVTAIGRNVTVRLNGKVTVELKDDPGRVKGYIAMQLHGGMDMEVMFKDIELRPMEAATADAEGFVPMFNGKDLTGWKTTGNWLVDDANGVVSLSPRKGEWGWQRFGAYLMTERKYVDFVIDLDFRFLRRGNSGVFCRVGDLKNPVTSGFEVQILDTHGKKKLSAHDGGGIISAATPTKNMMKPAGEWNHYTITVKGKRVTVVLNGEQIVDLDMSKSPLKDRPARGHVGFQDEGKRVWYRNVRIKELPTKARKGS